MHPEVQALHLIDRHFGGDLAGKTIVLRGLAFNPSTDDMQEAPSRILREQLWAAGTRVQAYDPETMEETRRTFGDRGHLILCDEPMDALDGADALVLITEWKVFWSPDFAELKACLNAPVGFDVRSIYKPEEAEAAGIAYYGTGCGRSVWT